MTTTIHPTRQARRLHLSHLATTHRAPLSGRAPTGVRTRTSFTPMTPEGGRRPAPRPEAHAQTRES
ncbi:hypothetical protein [Oryzobacter telluris]|uniref:hypothetical protein n=1 Tax=Oryzobacter telluris TaxID=3149179 RepID=UPI00370D07D1